MYIRGLIPWNFAELAEAVQIDTDSSGSKTSGKRPNYKDSSCLLWGLLEPYSSYDVASVSAMTQFILCLSVKSMKTNIFYSDSLDLG